MFSIHGVNGPMFKGPMEDFRRVMRTLGVSKTRKLDPLLEHMDEVDQAANASLHHPVKGAGHAVAQQARSAYAKVQQPEVPERQPLRLVSEVMSTHVVTVRDTDSLREAWHQLQSAGVGQAPVVNPQGQVVGLITRADLVRLDQLPSPEQSPLVWLAVLAKPVADVMVSPVPAANPDTDLRRLAQVLLDTDYPGLPVMAEADNLVGFVTRADILKAIANEPPLDIWS